MSAMQALIEQVKLVRSLVLERPKGQWATVMGGGVLFDEDAEPTPATFTGPSPADGTRVLALEQDRRVVAISPTGLVRTQGTASADVDTQSGRTEFAGLDGGDAQGIGLSDGKFEIQATGVYMFTATAVFSSNPNGFREVAIFAQGGGGGGSIAVNDRNANSGRGTTVTAIGAQNLDVGTAIGMNVYQDSGSTLNTFCRLQVTRVA